MNKKENRPITISKNKKLLRLCLIVLCVITPFSNTLLAKKITYIQASSEKHHGKPASYAYNSVDGRENTSWCSTSGPDKESLNFHFSSTVSLNKFSIISGAIRSYSLDKKYARVKNLQIFDGQTLRTFIIRDSDEKQSFKLDPPIRSSEISLLFTELYSGRNAESPLCISEIQLFSGKRKLTGRKVATRIRALNTPSRRLLHTWTNNPDAPEKNITFSLDGHFVYNFEDFIYDKPVRLKGTWSYNGRKLHLKIRGKTYTFRTRLHKSDAGFYTSMSLEGKKTPHEGLQGDFFIARNINVMLN